MRWVSIGTFVLVSCNSLVAAAAHAADGSYPVTVREIGGCKKAALNEHGHVGTAQREGVELVVPVVTVDSCRLGPKEPEARLSGNAITLLWAWDGLPAECLCVHHLEFRISGLPEGSYDVTAPVN